MESLVDFPSHFSKSATLASIPASYCLPRHIGSEEAIMLAKPTAEALEDALGVLLSSINGTSDDALRCRDQSRNLP